jgi:hypothetical protein
MKAARHGQVADGVGYGRGKVQVGKVKTLSLLKRRMLS